MSRRKREGTVYQLCSRCNMHLVETPDVLGVKLTDWWIVRGTCGVCQEGVLLRARFAERVEPKPEANPQPPVVEPVKKKPRIPKQIGRDAAEYHSRPGLNNWSLTAAYKTALDQMSKRWEVELIMVERDGKATTEVCRQIYHPELPVPFSNYYLIPGV